MSFCCTRAAVPDAPPSPQHLLFLSRIQFTAAPAPDAAAPSEAPVAAAAASLRRNAQARDACDSDSSDLDRLQRDMC
jgi:hypothetical protein